MIDELFLILDYIEGNLISQTLLFCAITLFFLFLILEAIAIRKKRRQEKAFFTPPIECVKEIFESKSTKKRKVFLGNSRDYVRATGRKP